MDSRATPEKSPQECVVDVSIVVPFQTKRLPAIGENFLGLYLSNHRLRPLPVPLSYRSAPLARKIAKRRAPRKIVGLRRIALSISLGSFPSISDSWSG